MIQLIPKKKKKEPFIKWGEIFGDFKLALSFGALIFVMLAYVGLAFYESGLNSEVESIVLRAQEIVGERDADLENEAQGLAKRINAIEGLLDSHLYASNFFTAIEETAHPSISFDALTLNTETGRASLNGLAPSYKIIGEQMVVLEDDPRFSSVKLFNLRSARSGDVSFTIEFLINEGVL